MSYEWDRKKARQNELKHGVTFQEAMSVFDDPLSEEFDDPDHSAEEGRGVVVGQSDLGRLIVVSFTERLAVTRISLQDLQQEGNKKNMKNEIRVYDDPNEDLEDDLRLEYQFDYSKARPNSYAARALRRKAIILETDIAEVFTTSEQVNKALRALIEAVPARPVQEKAA